MALNPAFPITFPTHHRVPALDTLIGQVHGKVEVLSPGIL